jgi:large subunit ribosomal protein L22
MKAFLKNNRQAPRKVRLIADAVRGRNVEEALATLSHTPNKAAPTLHKLIMSAVANARQEDVSIKESDLFIRTITVDKGITYVRYMPRAFGRASPINRESSHIRVTLGRIDAPTIQKAPVLKTKGSTETKKKTAKKTKADTAKVK